MNKTISIWFLVCYCSLLSGSLISVGHDFLHATSDITGIHQHELEAIEVTQEPHGHGHHHHVSDHTFLFMDLISFSEEGKAIFTSMVFLSFYYEPFYELKISINAINRIDLSIYYWIYLDHLSSPLTPPPEEIYTIS